jgi:hypothetical protein
MGDIGQLVELLRAEAREAREHSEQAAAETLRQMSDDVGEMSAEQQEWVGRASEEELRGFVKAVRLLAG